MQNYFEMHACMHAYMYVCMYVYVNPYHAKSIGTDSKFEIARLLCPIMMIAILLDRPLQRTDNQHPKVLVLLYFHYMDRRLYA